MERSHAGWNRHAYSSNWIALVRVFVASGLNQWTESDFFSRGVGVNEGVKAFFSAGRVWLSHSPRPSLRWEPEWRARTAHARSVFRKRELCSACLAVQVQVHGHRKRFKRNNAMNLNRRASNPEVRRFVSASFATLCTVKKWWLTITEWLMLGGRCTGSFSLINIIQALLCTGPTRTHTVLASHSSDGAHVERESESERGNQGDGW